MVPNLVHGYSVGCSPLARSDRLIDKVNQFSQFAAPLRLGNSSELHTRPSSRSFPRPLPHISLELNVDKSWYKDHFLRPIPRPDFSSENKGLISTDRGTKTTLMRTIPRSILSRIQRICLLLYFKCFSARQPSLSGGSWTVHRKIVETKSLVSFDKHWKSAHRCFQPGF